jgi:PilZ domain-containing protein
MEDQNNTAAFKCVSCGSTRIRRSARRGFAERVVLRLFRLHPFHCVDCYKRFYSRFKSIPIPQRKPESIFRGPQPSKQHVTEEKKTLMRSNMAERRYFSRLGCRIPARITVGSGSSISGTLSSISLSGCFIEAAQTIPSGNEFELKLEIGEGVHIRALVRTALPGMGMGVEFTDMTVPNFRRLRSIARESIRLQADP